jgi:hypothetical protein
MCSRYNTEDEDDAKDAVARFEEFLARERQTTAKSTAEKNKGQAPKPKPS